MATVWRPRPRRVQVGDVVLVYEYYLDPAWARRAEVKSRPCWVASLDADGPAVMRFSTRPWRTGASFSGGEFGLGRDTRLTPDVVALTPWGVGPRIGWINPAEVIKRLREAETVETCDAIRAAIARIGAERLAA